MKRNLIKMGGTLLLAFSLLTGCATEKGKETEETTSSQESPAVAVRKELDYRVEPSTFALQIMTDGYEAVVSQAMPERVVENYTETENGTTWTYTEEQVDVALEPQDGYLRVRMTSKTQEDNEFRWPEISGETYYMPLGEGKRIPAGDAVWGEYLSGQEFDVLEQLSMPFWASVQGDHAVLYILENPYRNAMEFGEGNPISFSLNHQYPEIDSNKEHTVRIYVTDNDPAAAAKIYRSYVIEQGDFVTLEEKAQSNPNIRKLYGAPHIYLAGDFIVSPENINWPAFRQALTSDAMKEVTSHYSGTETGKAMQTTVSELLTQDYVSEYQKNVVCRYLSEFLQNDTDHQSAKIQLNKQALAAKLPDVFQPVETWMNGETVSLLEDMKQSGIDQAWVGLHNWEQAYAKPELSQTAIDLGYLVGPYDSYHSIHKPGEEKWNTASFPDPSLYENAVVAKKNGDLVSGFQNVGRKLNPTRSLPSVKERLETILDSQIPFNSWFIDCDATGEIYDDYSPAHTTTQQQDLAARLERMAYIRDDHKMVIGSEGGNDFAASTIAFAHGIELRTFSWMDEDMKSNKESEYYIGNYYNGAGGAAEHFTKRIPVKEHLYTLFVDPKYDIPLFKLVYNDSVITTYHWDWSTFKIIGAVKDRMLREVLYNVPPLYHLDGTQWETYKEDMVSHTKVWSEFSKQVITKEMTDFKNLEEDGSVQLCRYGDQISVVANFGETAYSYEGNEIPAHGLQMKIDGVSTIYEPQLAEGNQ